MATENEQNSQPANEENKTGESIENIIAEKARKLLVQSQIYKQPRMNRIALYEALYNNDVPPRLRQMFNVIPPIFSGMVDSLLSQFNDEVKIKYTTKNPAQHLVIPKVQAHFDTERSSTEPNAMWNYKTRTDRFNAVLSGVGNLEEYAYNDPEYTNVLEVVNYSDFHCQPLGGGILEKHTFAGKEGCFKSDYELQNDSKYDSEQVKKLTEKAWTSEDFITLETQYGTRFERWRALGFDVENNSFSGDKLYNLCDFIVMHDGQRWNVVFEPCTGIWVYCKPWKETRPSGKYPWHCWHTHEDDKNFWNKAYADDFYNIADAIIIMVNQELTNREKKNFHGRAYDKDMFTDVSKLDAAQYKPDALVPANTMGGVKKIAEGIYEFTTPELKGTIDLVQWLSSYTADKVGTDEISPINKGDRKNIAIQLGMQAKQSKRIGLRAASFKECYSALGQTYIEGLAEYMPPKVSVQIIGENGFTEEAELKRLEVKGLKNNIGITIVSTAEQEQADQLKKDSRIKAIQMVAENPNLTRYEKETIYRDVGQYTEDEIAFLLDAKGEISKKQIGHAAQNIQDILLDKVPDIYYGADIAYMNYLNNYLIDHKKHVWGKEEKFIALLKMMSPIVEENMIRLAKNAPVQPQVGSDGKPVAPVDNGAGGKPTEQKLSLNSTARKMAGAVA